MRREIPTLFLLAVVILFSTNFVLATPNGASMQVISSERTPSGDASNVSAIAGNITQLNIFVGGAGSQTWQGYYGNVSGGLNLGDASNNILYNWSLASPNGEVYASTNSSISWINIQCFNFSASGIYTDESGNGGTTNMYGTNITTLESEYNIDSTDIDGINETFSNNNHDQFVSSSLLFSENECKSIQLFTNESESQDGVFEEMILYEPVSRSVVFTSILEDSGIGFNDAQMDFQMIVPEDGHGTDVDVTQYYFFIEIE